ncbi:MAG: PQQ-binding-like beta-propeller repeat protein, partial [Planctomycetaceae bacterium]
MQTVCLLLLLLLPNDWPKFRGPQADAHAAGPPTPMQWSDSQNVKWKVSVPGLGWSSPSVVGKKLWLTTAVPVADGLSLRCLCLDADSGKTIWDTEVRKVAETPKIHTKNSHASPTPIVDDGSVYVHFGALGMARLDAENGSILWLNSELVYPPLHGSGGSPVLHDGRLAIVCDGSTDPFVAAVEAKSGKVLWKKYRSVKARISHSFVTVSVAEVDGRALVMAPGPDHF